MTWAMGRSMLRVLAVGCVATTLLSSCKLFSTPDPRTIPAKLVEFQATVTLKPLWQASVGKSGQFVFTPKVVGENVYAANADGQLVALSAVTGKQLWRIDTGKKLSGGVGASASLVLVGTQKGELLSYDNLGKASWTAQLGAELLSPAAIDEKVAVVRTGDGRLVAFNVPDGERKWVYSHTNPALTLRTHQGALVVRGAVFSGYSGGLVVALDLESGRIGWESVMSPPRGATELERIADVSGLPVIDGTQICAVAYQGRVGCLEATTGKQLWSRDASSSAGVAVDDKNVYVADENGNVMALDRRTGSSVWKQDQLANRKLGTPIVRGTSVLVGDGFGYIHALSTDTGAFVGRLDTDGSALTAPPQRAGDAVLFQTRGGSIYAVQVN
jgi:outer membrane protein assembly factor BamB